MDLNKFVTSKSVIPVLSVFVLISILPGVLLNNLQITIGLIGVITFIAISWNVYLSHFQEPQSDLVFISEVGTTSNPNSTRGGEIQMELYFTIHNRGEDIGHVVSYRIDHFEFFDDEDSETIEPDEMKDPVYGTRPIIVMNHIVDNEKGYRRGDVTVYTGKDEEIQIIPRIWPIPEVDHLKEKFPKARAQISFEVVDASGSHTKTVLSEPIDANELKPP